MISRKTTKEFNTHIFDGLRRGLFHIVTGSLKSTRKRGPFVSQQDRSECLDILSQVDIAKMWHNFGATQKYGFVNWLFRIWEVSRRPYAAQIRLRLLHILLMLVIVGISGRAYE